MISSLTSNKMSTTDGYSTPISFLEDKEDPHGPLSPPTTPRQRKQTIGVKRMPSHLAMPDLDEHDSTNDADDLPKRLLKPRTDLSSLLYGGFMGTSLISTVALEVVLRSTKRQRHQHHYLIRSSPSPSNAHAHTQTPRKSSRADSCDW